MHKFLFYNKFIICLYMFRALCAQHQEVKIVLYSIWYQVAVPCTGRPPTVVMIPDTVQYTFNLLMMSTLCTKHLEA